MTHLVLIASYPKSGNTWLRAFLTSIRRDGAPVDINALDAYGNANRAMFDTALEVETSDLLNCEIDGLKSYVLSAYSRRKDYPIFLKIHDAWLPTPGTTQPPFPRDDIGAVVYIVRDPRDVVVSYAHHLGYSFDATIERLADVELVTSNSVTCLKHQIPQFVSSWSAHVESWLDSGLPIHCIRYEDMIADSTTVFAGVCRFLEIAHDPDVLDRALTATEFERLQSEEAAKGFKEALPTASARFFRRGIAGGWRDLLMPDQADKIVASHGDTMRRLGYAP